MVRAIRVWAVRIRPPLPTLGRGIVLRVDASDGVRWEIAHVLRSGHANKTLFVLNPSVDVQSRTRLLMEGFWPCAADLGPVNVDRILALRATSPELILMYYASQSAMPI